MFKLSIYHPILLTSYGAFVKEFPEPVLFKFKYLVLSLAKVHIMILANELGVG